MFPSKIALRKKISWIGVDRLVGCYSINLLYSFHFVRTACVLMVDCYLEYSVMDSSVYPSTDNSALVSLVSPSVDWQWKGSIDKCSFRDSSEHHLVLAVSFSEPFPDIFTSELFKSSKLSVHEGH